MEIIGKISKGSRMDQIYLPKNRENLSIGSYVLIKPLESEFQLKQKDEKLYFYNISSIEPIKLEIIKQIIASIKKLIKNYENIIITGSFLDKGFNFNDIDMLIISEGKINLNMIEKAIEDKIKIKIHIIALNNKTLVEGLSTDPLYQIMLSKCVVKKRFVYKSKRRINYKILDLHLLKSKNLIDNFDVLNGNEKYDLTRNLVAISLYLEKRKIGKEEVDRKIMEYFNLKDIKEIKQNILNKTTFIKKYKLLCNNTFNEIMQRIKENKTKNKNASKQEQVN